MLNKLISFVVVFALVALVVNIFPVAMTWLTSAIGWVLSFGKWGIIALTTLCLAFFFDWAR